MKRYIIRKSKEPDGRKKYILVIKSKTKQGINEGRVFKGTFKQCAKIKEELLNGC